jgi:hypothetical protein
MNYNYSTLKNFVDNFAFCPKCNSSLHIEATSNNSNHHDHHNFDVNIQGEKLIINITSEFFIAPKKQQAEFSISIINGNIVSCDRGNEFVSIYDLDITLSKSCISCIKNNIPPETFYQSISIFYARQISSFKAIPITEYFSFSKNDLIYKFVNDFKEGKSFIQTDKIKFFNKTSIISSPYIPFTKFNFADKEMLFSKINSILLLR